MVPEFNKSLDQAPAARYLVVKSGTSRLVVLDGTDIRPGAEGRGEILRLMKGADGCGGLGGANSQENKVALVWPREGESSFQFRFYQVVPGENAVLPMECSNSASSAAMLASLGKHGRMSAERWKSGKPVDGPENGVDFGMRSRHRPGLADSVSVDSQVS